MNTMVCKDTFQITEGATQSKTSEFQRTSRIPQGKEAWGQQGWVLNAMYSEITTLLGVGDVPSGK